jgi:hypothetical protein
MFGDILVCPLFKPLQFAVERGFRGEQQKSYGWFAGFV